jgi:hypothetical protein
MFSNLKVGDTITIIGTPCVESTIIRITPKYIVVESGDKYRISTGEASGMAKGYLGKIIKEKIGD